MYSEEQYNKALALYLRCHKKEVRDVIPRAGKAAGYDFGLKHFLDCDDGTAIHLPEWYNASL